MHGNSEIERVKSTLDIPTSMKTVVDNVSSHQTPNQLHVPKTKNYTAIDAWIPGIGVFRMTVAKKDAIFKGEEAKRDLVLLGDGSDNFVLATPPFVLQVIHQKAPQDIDQYAVLIPYPEQRKVYSSRY